MEENKKVESGTDQSVEEKSMFDFQTIYSTLVLNWKWFILSLIICLGMAAIYLRYATPQYQASAKILIKDDNNSRSRFNNSALQSTLTSGMISYSNGIENEIEILKSRTIAEQAVRDLKLYVTYSAVGKVKKQIIYPEQPLSIDIDPAHLEKLSYPITLKIQREGSAYHITGSYFAEDKTGIGEHNIDQTIKQLPATIGTRVGIISIYDNAKMSMGNGAVMLVSIESPRYAATKYLNHLSVSQTNKTTTIAQLVLKDVNEQRAKDYLKQLAICFNRQANEDKNEVALRTEEFINSRLEKINAELGSTEGALERYKKSHNMVEQQMNAGQAMQNQDAYSQKLNEANTQVALIQSVKQSMNGGDAYQTLPTNVGIQDANVTSLIDKYNDLALQRNKLLRSASETSPTVTPLTSQLDDLHSSIQRAMDQATRNLIIQRNSVASQFGKYVGQVNDSPEQERILTQIGRQQEVKSGLYLMLLQKREENSISLAATADKGKLIDNPESMGKVSPKSSLIMLLGLLLGLAIPSLILFLIQFFRYKIEGHDDVVKLTSLPILADVPVASDTAKTKADIVVHENQNNQMEEIFRSMRTNLQFMLKQGEKVVMFTSTTSGEGKTFNAANLAMSFALLDKKVVLVGLDIRKPRLAELLEIDDHHHGITPLLIKDEPTWNDIHGQILPSGISNNLDVLMAGPIPPNPAELIARPSLEVIVDHLKEHYDYVLIDTAPVGLVTDTLQIGRVANATVYMCRADYTPKDSFNLINALANDNKMPNMCLVLNGIDMSKKKYGYYYGYGNYGKYGKYGRYGSYGKSGNSSYGNYGNYGSYGDYANSHYGDKNDSSIKR